MRQLPDIDSPPEADPTPVGVDALQRRLGYRFTDPHLLKRALTHASSTAEKGADNERLEFFGDSVLDLFVSEYLFHECPDRCEGDLTQLKSEVVRKRSLARASQRLGVREHLILGRGIAARPSLPASIYANTYEALVAAIYVDGGVDATREFVLRTLSQELHEACGRPLLTNHKSLLQQHLQRTARATPEYRVVSQWGPDHAMTFKVAALVDGAEVGRGTGSSKKEAEQASARDALRRLAVGDEPDAPA